MAVVLQGRIALDWSQVRTAMRGTQMAVRSFVNVTGRGLYDAGRNLLRFGAIWGAVGAGIAAWGLKKAADFEILKLRLENAIGDAAKARRAWDETLAFSVRSPLQLEPLVRARVMLINFGLTGQKALVAVANAAIMTGRQVEDVASAISSLETEPLRRMGITARSRSVRTADGDITQFRFSFRDRNQIKHEVRVTGIEEARKAITSILGNKYGGAADRMAKTWQGVWSSFTDIATQAAAKISDALRVQLIPAFARLNEWAEKALSAGTFERFGQRMYLWVGNFIRNIRAMIATWNDLSTATRDQLQNMLIVSGAFALAWKVELLQPIIKGLAYLVVTNKWAFMAMAMTISGFAALVAGLKIGVAIEKGFGLSTFMLKWALTLKDMGITLRNNFTLWTDMAAIAGKGIWKALRGDASAAQQTMADIGARWQSWFDRMNPFSLKGRLDEEFAKIDELNTAMGEGPDKSVKQRLDDFIAELDRQFTTAEGWLETAQWLIPEPIKKALDELFASFRKNLANLPDIRLSTGSAGLADDMGEAAEDAKTIARMMEPLRGFSTGNYGVRRPASRVEAVGNVYQKAWNAPAPAYRLPGIPAPGTGWGTIDWSKVGAAGNGAGASGGPLPLPRGGIESVDPQSTARYAEQRSQQIGKAMGRGELLGGAGAEIGPTSPEFRAMQEQWRRAEFNPMTRGFGQAIPYPRGLEPGGELWKQWTPPNLQGIDGWRDTGRMIPFDGSPEWKSTGLHLTPAGSAGPLLKRQAQVDAEWAAAGAGADIGSMVNQQSITNQLLRSIFNAKSTFRFE